MSSRDREVQATLSASAQDFLALVWPAIGHRFGAVIPVETVSANEFARELDRRAGVDVWLLSVHGDMRGLASRVQWPRNGEHWPTFTVRTDVPGGGRTEYDKRKAEIETNGAAISPYYTVQAYIAPHPDKRTSPHDAHLLAAAIARTRDIIDGVTRRVGWYLPWNPEGSRGYVVPWSALPDNAIEIWLPPQYEQQGGLW